MATFNSKKKGFTVLIIVFLVIAYLADLGYPAMTYKTDEPRRALVAMEMMFPGDYITPTIQGALYFNKPPLYNWIIIFYYTLFGNFSLFALRLPVIVATAAIGVTSYLFIKKYTNKTVAFLTAMAFVTNGRILIYESLQGLIDVTLAWVIYLLFMLVFYFGEKEKYWQLFISTWVLAAVGYLMKGLPAVVFEGITLLTYFVWKNKFNKLFHKANFVGFGIFIVILSVYYTAYFARNNVAPSLLFGTLLDESSKRTIAEFGALKTIQHFIASPFTLFYHFAPWMLFALVLLRKNIRTIIRRNSFIEYNCWILLTNIFVYWTSPQVYARYLFMFVPLIFVILMYVYQQVKTQNEWQVKTIHHIIQFICIAICVVVLAIPFIPVANNAEYICLKVTFLFIAFAASAFVAFKYKPMLLYSFLFSLAIFRLGFNWFVIEQRGQKDFIIQDFSNKIATITKGQPLHILTGAQMGNLDAICFETGIQRKEIITFSDTSTSNGFFIADEHQLQHASYTNYLNFYSHGSDSLHLVKFNH